MDNECCSNCDSFEKDENGKTVSSLGLEGKWIPIERWNKIQEDLKELESLRSQPRQGLYGKYIVSKSDGTPIDPNADYFILRLDTDPVARLAAREYSYHTHDRDLAKELQEKIARYGCIKDSDFDIDRARKLEQDLYSKGNMDLLIGLPEEFGELIFTIWGYGAALDAITRLKQRIGELENE